MTITAHAVRTALGATALAAASLIAAPTAGADVQALGASQRAVDGPLVTDYTVSNLRPSTATIPGFQPAGQLYQADVTAKSVDGTVQPKISNFAARAFNGTSYPVVNTGPVPDGLDPSPITQGAQTSGELYFDITGQRPVGVVYTDGSDDFLVWTRHA
ncbi:hypothetical protein A5647_14415 [Mycobacterium sp. 1100029.7]|nr:hypothetical protein A5647_14415 [Mycobacterium sp. 1100029.7]